MYLYYKYIFIYLYYSEVSLEEHLSKKETYSQPDIQ